MPGPDQGQGFPYISQCLSHSKLVAAIPLLHQVCYAQAARLVFTYDMCTTYEASGIAIDNTPESKVYDPFLAPPQKQKLLWYAEDLL